jgi:hypothetical protein
MSDTIGRGNIHQRGSKPNVRVTNWDEFPGITQSEADALYAAGDDRRITGARPVNALWNTLRQIRNTGQNGIPMFAVFQMGDSYAQIPENQLLNRFGLFGRLFSSNSTQLSGGATNSATDYTESPAGRYVNLPSGGAAVFGDSLFGSHVHVYYRTRPGDGTFKVQTEINSLGVWTDVPGMESIDANAADGWVHLRSDSLGDARSLRMRVVGLSGTARIIMGGVSARRTASNNGRGGCFFIDLSVGGSNHTQWITTPEAAWIALRGGIATYEQMLGVAFWRCDDGDITPSMPTIIERMGSGLDHVFIGSHPASNDGDPLGDRGGMDAALRSWAPANGHSFMDVRRYFPPFVSPASDPANFDFYADSTHLGPLGRIFLNSLVWARLEELLGFAFDYGGSNQPSVASRGELNYVQGVNHQPQGDSSRVRPHWWIRGPLDTQEGAIGFQRLDGASLSYGTGWSMRQIPGNHATMANWVSLHYNTTYRILSDQTRWIFTNGVSGMTRALTATVESMSAATSRPSMRLSGPDGMTADYLQAFAGASTSAAGTQVFALDAAGNVSMRAVGAGIQIKEGTNARMGVATLVAGTVTVANTSVTANSRIFLTSQSDGGTPGWLRVSGRTAGTSFTITSSDAADTSTVAWMIVEPAP